MFVAWDKVNNLFFTEGCEWVPERSKALEFCDRFIKCYPANEELVNRNREVLVLGDTETYCVVWWCIGQEYSLYATHGVSDERLRAWLYDHGMSQVEIANFLLNGTIEHFRNQTWHNVYKLYRFNRND